MKNPCESTAEKGNRARFSPEVTVDEDGDKDRKTSGAIEEITEGEVEEEDGDVVA